MEDAPLLRKCNVPKWYGPASRFRWLYLLPPTLYIVACMVFRPDTFAPGIIEIGVGAVAGVLLEITTRSMLRALTARTFLRARGGFWRRFFAPPTGYDVLYTLMLLGAFCVPALISWLLHQAFPLGLPWSGAAPGAVFVCVWVWAVATMISGKRWYDSLPE